MFTKIFRSFSFKPNTPLEFIEGKCLLLHEYNVETVRNASETGLLIATIGSISILGVSKDTLMMILWYAAYSTTVNYWSKNIVRAIYLNEDGEHIGLNLNGTRTLKTIKISSIQPEELLLGEDGRWVHCLRTTEDDKYLVLHSSQCTNKEVLEKIFLGENISTDKSE